MLRSKYKLVTLVVLCLCVSASSIQGGSFYSSKGIGLRRYFVSGRSVGMGGVGLSISDNFTVNYLNPSALAGIVLTSISGNFLHESTGLKNLSQDANISDTNIFGLHFVIPIKSNTAVFALGVSQFSNIEYSFSNRDTSSEKSFNQTVNGDGGINTANISLAIKPFKKLSLGVTGLFYFGKLRSKWDVIFDSSDFLNTQDEVARSFSAVNLRFGVLYQILSGWSIGAVFTPSVKLNAKKSITLSYGKEFTDFPDNKIKLPVAFGIGTALNINRKLLFGVDFYTQKWSDAKSGGIVNDSKRIAVGIEYSANGSFRDSYFSRVAYRAGFHYRDLGLEDPIGEKVTEIFGSIGLGLPVKWTAAKIDLSLEGGRRGSLSNNPFRETIIRITGSVTVGEKWFYRGNK